MGTLTTPLPLSLADYRGLRGVVVHVLPAARERSAYRGRRAWALTFDIRDIGPPLSRVRGHYGRCLWCGQEALSPKGNGARWQVVS